jgi:hypothetical protein
LNDDTGEHWLPVPGYHGKYEASSLGRIRSNARHGPKPDGGILKQEAHSSGHLYVKLYDSAGCSRSIQVHRLVCETFNGPCPAAMECRHLDGNAANNQPGNLIWGTRAENTEDAVKHGTHAQSRKTHCPQGHEYTEDNMYVYGGHRHCKTCLREREQTAAI